MMAQIVILPFVIGVLLALAAAAYAIRSLRRCLNWSSAQGEVTRVEEDRNPGGRKAFHPEIRFIARDGQEVSFLSDIGTTHPSYRVGDKVQVLYDRRNPARAAIGGFFTMWFPALLVALLAAAFLYVGLRG